MTAPELSSLVAAVVALVTAVTTYLRTRPGRVTVRQQSHLLSDRLTACEKHLDTLESRLKP